MLLENVFEPCPGKEDLMGFVSKNKAKLISHLLKPLVLKASCLVTLLKGLIVQQRNFESLTKGLGLNYLLC